MSEVECDRQDWITLDIPGSGVRFRYPARAASRAPIDVDQLRVHPRSTGTREIYLLEG